MNADRINRAIEILRKDYEFRVIRGNEYELLISFINNHWKKGHVLVKSKKLLDWNYYDEANDTYCFYAAINKKDGNIHALQGYIPTGQYDPALGERKVWGSIWKARADVEGMGLGAAVHILRLLSHKNLEWAGGYGISEKGIKNTKKIYPNFGFMKQYFIPNNSKNFSFQISDGLQNLQENSRCLSTPNTASLDEIRLEEFRNFPANDDVFLNSSKYKSQKYYENRYFLHPYWKYHFYALKLENTLRAIFIIRKVKHEDSLCLRIVDYIGDLRYIEASGSSLRDLVVAENAEYIDFMESGIDDHLLTNAGFLDLDNYENVIVPNYFEPFLKSNIRLPYVFNYFLTDDLPVKERVIFKGDADQDRPNIL